MKTPARQLIEAMSAMGRPITVAEMEAKMGPGGTRVFRAHMAGLKAMRSCAGCQGPACPDGDCYMRAYSAGMAS